MFGKDITEKKVGKDIFSILTKDSPGIFFQGLSFVKLKVSLIFGENRGKSN